ncbi:PAS domain S-box protein [Cupriavidus necator]|uniref:PAS domain S-box protein n=1 Tax=Cupriavidus necator TaxID=106590 RepID=UPI0039C290F5
MESTGTLVVITNDRGEIKYGNRSFARIFGYHETEFEGAVFWDLLRCRSPA